MKKMDDVQLPPSKTRSQNSAFGIKLLPSGTSGSVCVLCEFLCFCEYYQMLSIDPHLHKHRFWVLEDPSWPKERLASRNIVWVIRTNWQRVLIGLSLNSPRSRFFLLQMCVWFCLILSTYSIWSRLSFFLLLPLRHVYIFFFLKI